jgi:hypothetical protein
MNKIEGYIGRCDKKTTEILWTSFFKIAYSRYSSYAFRARISWKDYTFYVYGIKYYESKKCAHFLETYVYVFILKQILLRFKKKGINLSSTSRSCKLFRPYTLCVTFIIIIIIIIIIQRSLHDRFTLCSKTHQQKLAVAQLAKLNGLLLKSEVRYRKQKDPAIGPHQVLAFQVLTQCCWCVSYLSILFPQIAHLTFIGGLLKKASLPPTADIKNIIYFVLI